MHQEEKKNPIPASDYYYLHAPDPSADADIAEAGASGAAADGEASGGLEALEGRDGGGR